MIDLILFQSTYLWVVVVGAFVSFADSFGIGANDVANSFGPSYGSRALTLMQIVVIASICEFIGAVFLGASVTDTVRKSIVDVEQFTERPDLLMLGMLSSLVGSSTWVLFASKHGLPVSTTHATIGAIVGFSMAAGGTAAVSWWKILEIVVSWFASPLLAAVVAALAFLLLRTVVLRHENSLQRGYLVLPVVVFITFVLNTVFIIYKGGKNWGWSKALGAGGAVGVAAGVGVLVTVVSVIFGLPYLKRRTAARIALEESIGSLALEDSKKTMKITAVPLGDKSQSQSPFPDKKKLTNDRSDRSEHKLADQTKKNSSRRRRRGQRPVNTGQSRRRHSTRTQSNRIGTAATADAGTADAADAGDGAGIGTAGIGTGSGGVNKSTSRTTTEDGDHVVVGGEQKSVSGGEGRKRLQGRMAMLRHKGTEQAIAGELDASDRVRQVHEATEHFDPHCEQLFASLQVCTAIFNSISHGSNDVANSIGAFAAIFDIYSSGRTHTEAAVPIWILVMGAVGIISGLVLYGYNVIASLGVKLISVTPSRGFIIELSAACVVLIASQIGIPISTTHAMVGASIGVGLVEARRRQAVNWRMFFSIFLAWIGTIVAAGLVSAAFFSWATFSPSIYVEVSQFATNPAARNGTTNICI